MPALLICFLSQDIQPNMTENGKILNIKTMLKEKMNKICEISYRNILKRQDQKFSMNFRVALHHHSRFALHFVPEIIISFTTHNFSHFWLYWCVKSKKKEEAWAGFLAQKPAKAQTFPQYSSYWHSFIVTWGK